MREGIVQRRRAVAGYGRPETDRRDRPSGPTEGRDAAHAFRRAPDTDCDRDGRGRPSLAARRAALASLHINA